MVFSRRRILFLNLLVKVLPYLPMNGNCSHILGSLSGVAVSVVPESSVLLLSWCGVKALMNFFVRLRAKPRHESLNIFEFRL